MKKILSIALALCLALSLSVSVFASAMHNQSPEVGPSYSPSITVTPGTTAGSAAASKLTFSAKDASGKPVTAQVSVVTGGSEYKEIEAYEVVGMWDISVLSANSGLVTFDLYCTSAPSKDDIVIVRDAWEAGLATLDSVSGNRATITVDAALINQYHYIALVKSFDAVTVAPPTQGTENDEDNADDDADNFDAADEPATTPADTNPTTGVALAVVPMMVAAAAVVASKRR